MMPLIGYADRLSARPGETIEFKVSSRADAPYQAGLVRVQCADPNPSGPGPRETPTPAAFAGRYPSREQAVNRGSYMLVESAPALDTRAGLMMMATVWPTRPGSGQQGIISTAGLDLLLGEDGSTAAVIRCDDGQARIVTTGKPMLERHWYRVWLCLDPSTGRLSLGQARLDDAHLGHGNDIVEISFRGQPQSEAAAIRVAALGPHNAHSHFNGKIERPIILSQPTSLPQAFDEEIIRESCWACWDFSKEISSTRAMDLGPHGLHGRLINMPARAMTGSTWNGQEMCWRHAPEHFGAIHFHDDDISDCKWETDFTFTVPPTFPSGLYAVRLSCGDNEDAIPFFVCPAKEARRADLCVLIPSFTYVIYGNHRRVDFGPHWHERARAWDAYPWNPAEHEEYGLSTYDCHSDGSGICHASRRRPLLTLRPGYISIAEERGSGLRHLQADTHLLDWLETKGYDFDILTDEQLHQEGYAAIEGYRCLLTASHPEYHTVETLNALSTYRDRGGRLCYLGGNGFYWRIAVHPEDPAVLEIRRGEGGIRAWAAEPGEYFNAFDGAYGGLWRRSGRPPQSLVGVGFSGQGVFEGSYYRRQPDASDPRVSWIFEGLDDDILGDFGLSGGGAAGYELDRVDRRLGSPPHTLVLARSEGHGPSFVAVPEELLTHVTTWTGEKPEELIRAEMAFFETAAGGAVFSTGSITFCGSLSHNSYDNNISRLLENVITRFLDPDAEFTLPE